eukprot:6694769-Pyramimonas_sp.AAC.1
MVRLLTYNPNAWTTGLKHLGWAKEVKGDVFDAFFFFCVGWRQLSLGLQGHGHSKQVITQRLGRQLGRAKATVKLQVAQEYWSNRSLFRLTFRMLTVRIGSLLAVLQSLATISCSLCRAMVTPLWAWQ